MMNERRALERLGAILAIALLSSCGVETKTGSNGTGSVPTTPPEPTVVAGTLVGVDPFAIGSVPLETGAAAFRQDETANAGSGGLRLGMNFEAAGAVIGTFGTAPVGVRDAGTQSAVRGPVASVDALSNRFNVATLTFTVDANTIYDGVNDLAALAPGAYVEVSGLPLADLRTILATRITRTPSPADGRISLAARIETLANGGFTIAGLFVPAASITVPPAGSRARVSGTLNVQASAISGEQIVFLPDFTPSVNTHVELEGIALNVDAAGGFRLRTPARDYEVAAGSAGPVPVTSGSRVRVIATAASALSLVPQSVTVIAPGQLTYRVTGPVSEFASLASLRVRGEPVDLTTAVIRGGSASDIGNGRRLGIVGVAGPGVLRVSEATILP
jgi:hypothetical protein